MSHIKKLSTILLLSSLTLTLIGCNTNESSTSQKSDENENLIKQQVTDSDTATIEFDKKQDSSDDMSEKVKGKALGVLDSGAIRVQIGEETEIVRLLSVDIPENNHPLLGTQPFGEEAINSLKEMLQDKTVELERDGDHKDNFGFEMVHLYVDGKSVQEELLRKGLARVEYPEDSNVKHAELYEQAQQDAKAQRLGIWSIENYVTAEGFNPTVK